MPEPGPERQSLYRRSGTWTGGRNGVDREFCLRSALREVAMGESPPHAFAVLVIYLHQLEYFSLSMHPVPMNANSSTTVTVILFFILLDLQNNILNNIISDVAGVADLDWVVDMDSLVAVSVL